MEDPSFVRHDNTLARPYISYTNADRVDVVLTNPPFGGAEEAGIESNFPAEFAPEKPPICFGVDYASAKTRRALRHCFT